MKLSQVTGAPPPAAAAAPPTKMRLSQIQAAPTGEDRALAAARESTKGDEVGGALYQGLTLGFGDELDALGAGAVTGAQNLVRKARGQDVPYTAVQAMAATKQAEKEAQERYQRDHPIAQPLTEIAGSMLIPGVGTAAKAIKGVVGSPFVTSVLLGAGVGGASAAGHSEGSPLERAAAAPGGALAGGLTGGAVHGALNIPGLLQRGSGAVSEAISRISSGLGKEQTEVTPELKKIGEKTGMKYVADLVRKLDPTGEKLKANATEKVGKPITAAEALGAPAETQLKVMGRRMGATPDKLRAQLSDRAREAGKRVVSDFHEVTGIDPETAAGNLETLTDGLRAKASPLYDAWHANGAIDSPELAAIRKTDTFQKAMKLARNVASDDRESAYALGLDEELPLEFRGKTIMDKKTGQPVMVSRDEALQYAKESGVQHSMAGEEPQKRPVAKAYDYAKRGMDIMLEQFRDPRTGRINTSNPDARRILKVRTELNNELTNPQQPWGASAKAAFDAGGEPIRLENAFHDAKELLSNNLTGAQFAKRLERYTPAEEEALKAGIVNTIRDSAMAGRTRLKEMMTDATIVKLQRVFGPEKAAELISRLNMEANMAQRGARMAPGIGSDTSETLMADKEQQEAINLAREAVKKVGRGHWVDAVIHVLSAPVVGAYRGAQAPIDEAARDIAGSLLAGRPSELAMALEAHGASKAEADKVSGILMKLKEKFDAATPRAAAAGGATAGNAAAHRTGVSISLGDQPAQDFVRSNSGQGYLVPQTQP